MKCFTIDQALNKWRDNMNNLDNEFILRIEDKGNRFIFVDKKTDNEKANEKIQKSNFERIHFDPSSSHIQKVKIFSKKWVRKAELSKECASVIANPNGQREKNSTLYKTHKPNIPVRLLTKDIILYSVTLYNIFVLTTGCL